MNSNQHTPLSKEDLFNLLDNKLKDKDAPSFNTNKEDLLLDDFEREALEGFSLNSNISESRKLVSEVDSLISNRVSKVSESSKRGKLIWFGAAASVVLIVFVSFIFLKQNMKNAEQLSLNSEITIQKDVGNLDISTKEINEEEIANKTFKSVEEKDNSSVKGFNSAVVNGKKEQSKSLEHYISTEKKAALKINTFEATSDDYSKMSQTAKDEVVLSDSEVNSVIDDNEVSAVAYESKDTRLRKEQSAPTAPASVSEKNVSESRKMSSNQVLSDSQAYYTGGELMIKRFVVDYYKNNKLVIIGDYDIKAKISEFGHLEVHEIVNTTQNCNECIPLIKEALNKMTSWNPAIKDGKKVPTSVSFQLHF